MFSHRPAYQALKLEEFQRGKQHVPVLALTATATRQLVQGLTDTLMITPQLITDPACRHNLQYEVRRRHGRQPCGNLSSIELLQLQT